ncbi:hypothetical protein BOX17_05120 [Halomonas aestuarii]|uniref:DUF1289 domain-containing protein n=1 Tax=Halomonas aestuarii TaxID=1897729 RepID=A0A1J0VEF4_9GAMM|nr:DUF1289 domain-containing protein [Halomonas aestuarii]APE30391.1 hypothetical protein BOX17_05120 [Halomonas aestuarii]
MSATTPMTTPRPASPCIRLCRVDDATDRCEGCGRYLDEIARWGSMDEVEREVVWQRLERAGPLGR